MRPGFQYRRHPADHFVAAIARGPLERGVHVFDYSEAIGHDDDIVRLLDDRRQLAQVPFASNQLGDVLIDDDRTDDARLAIAQRHGRIPDHPALTVEALDLDLLADMGFPFPHRTRQWPVIRRDGGSVRQPPALVFVILFRIDLPFAAPDAPARRIREADATTLIGDPHAHRNQVESLTYHFQAGAHRSLAPQFRASPGDKETGHRDQAVEEGQQQHAFLPRDGSKGTLPVQGAHQADRSHQERRNRCAPDLEPHRRPDDKRQWGKCQRVVTISREGQGCEHYRTDGRQRDEENECLGVPLRPPRPSDRLDEGEEKRRHHQHADRAADPAVQPKRAELACGNRTTEPERAYGKRGAERAAQEGADYDEVDDVAQARELHLEVGVPPQPIHRKQRTQAVRRGDAAGHRP